MQVAVEFPMNDLSDSLRLLDCLSGGLEICNLLAGIAEIDAEGCKCRNPRLPAHGFCS
jgi:hypothetical protein